MIRELIVEGRSHYTIIQQLQIPERTYFRYLNKIFEYDREIMRKRIPREEAMHQLAITITTASPDSTINIDRLSLAFFICPFILVPKGTVKRVNKILVELPDKGSTGNA
jgi:hypothetical protein